MVRIVIDTNVIIAALRSRRGASYRLMQLVGSDLFRLVISVPLILEYEAVAVRLIGIGLYNEADLDSYIDYICQVADQTQIHFLWRPFLPDAKDDMVLEAAVAANCDGIITFNISDFRAVDQFGLQIWTPAEFLRRIGEIK